MVLGLLLTGLTALAGPLIKDLVTGKKAGTSHGEIASSAVKVAKGVGSGVAKGAKRIFGAPSFGAAFGEIGKIATEFGGTVGKGIEVGTKLLDVGEILGPLFGQDTTSFTEAGEEAIKVGQGGQAKLFELGRGFGDVSKILAGI